MKTTGMIATALVVLLGWTCAAQSQDELKQKVHELEKRVAKLEAGLGPVLARIAREQAVEEQRLKARARMRQDSEVYSREALSKIEGLYQIANKKWGSEAGKESLKQLVSHYDKANRTGCALLYLGGDRRIQWLLLWGWGAGGGLRPTHAGQPTQEGRQD